MTHKVPVQSLIDHIKTAIDIDLWAKEMVEELLKEQDELLHKKQKDINRLCNEISEWKHKFHDISLKEQEVTEQLSDAVHETAKQFRQTIVRCKDCKHYDDVTNECADIGSPCYRNGWCKPDWFCADGERKEGDS